MADPAADDALRKELSELSPSDFKGAYADGSISKRRFDLLCSPNDKLTNAEKRDKFDALVAVGIWKRRRTRKYKHLSGAEKFREHVDRYAAIDDKLADARAKIDWPRRRAAEASLLTWAATYCTGVSAGGGRLLDYAPTGKLTEAVQLMEAAVGDSSTYYHLQVARSHGKTSFAECAIAYALATARRRFAVVVSAKTDAAAQIAEDVFNVFVESPPFVQDYPDIALPLVTLNGSWHRRITLGGKRVKVAKTAGKFTLPTGAMLVSHGFDGRVRGMKAGAMRPDMLLLDDLQSDQDAASEEIVRKSLDKIRRSFLNLGGRDRMAVLMTSTPIQPDDVSEQIAKDAAWRTTSFPAVLSWPDEWKREDHGLWGEYRKVYERELYTGDGTTDPRKVATEFYIANREAMDAGAAVLDPERYDRRVQVSAIQSALDTYFDVGEDAFLAELMMRPRRRQYVFEITPRTVMARVVTGSRMGEIPPGTVFTVAATDINPSYAISSAIMAFKADRTARVVGYALTKCHLDDRANDTQYHQQLYALLVAHGQALHDLGVKLDAWGIDAGGKQIVPVTALGERGEQLCGVKAFPLIGRSWNRWQPRPRSMIWPGMNDFVICGDPIKKTRWAFWNADRYREEMHRAWGTETGAPGGLTLFDGNVDHTDFASQIANERLVGKVKMLDGRYDCRWQTKEPHDFGDCCAMGFALAAGLRNITGECRPGVGPVADGVTVVAGGTQSGDDGLFAGGYVEL